MCCLKPGDIVPEGIAVKSVFSILGMGAALVMCAVSGAMNYLFMASLGKTPLEGHVLGAASAAADVLKALLPFFIAWSWRDGRVVAAMSGLIAFLFFVSFSLMSALGFAADNRGLLVDGRKNLNLAYERMQRELDDIERQSAALSAHRPAAVVSEEIRRHQQSRRWNATKECADATEIQSREYCATYFALRAELAASLEAERLKAASSYLQAEVQKLRAQGAGHDVDPQVSMLARITGIEAERVRLALVIAVAVLVEFGASLGLFLASGHGSAVEGPLSSPDQAAMSNLPLPKVVGSVEDFCLEGLVAAESSVMDSDQLEPAYAQWCASTGYKPLAAEEFQKQFGSIAQAVGLSSAEKGWSGLAAA